MRLGRMSIPWNGANLFSPNNDLPLGRGHAPHGPRLSKVGVLRRQNRPDSHFQLFLLLKHPIQWALLVLGIPHKNGSKDAWSLAVFLFARQVLLNRQP